MDYQGKDQGMKKSGLLGKIVAMTNAERYHDIARDTFLIKD